jgi:hypothetical protein
MAFGKSMVAIFAGFSASFIVKYFSIVAVFDVALVFLSVCACAIALMMDENYGSREHPKSSPVSHLYIF